MFTSEWENNFLAKKYGRLDKFMWEMNKTNNHERCCNDK